MIASRLSTACGFSIFAITGTRRPTSSMISRTRTTSSGLRTKESATRSAPRRRPQRRSASSLSDSAGTFTATPGRLMPLLFETVPATMTSVRTRTPSVSSTCDAHLAVVDQQGVARLHVLRKALEGRADEVLRAEHVLGGDREDVALGELVGPVGEAAEADLRPLQVDQHGDRAAGVVGGAPHLAVDALVHLVAAVAEVHPGDVDAGLDDRPDVLVARGRRPQGGDDLRSSHRWCVRQSWFGMCRVEASAAGEGLPTAADGCRVSARSVGRTGAGSSDSPSR